ncbi:cytochrome P450 [Halobacillus massiliensis]|uniref:cytochrome P450 n=1 Tax=Halobacillus massiliensis TaxID=1926286 RepID=UPI00117A112E|nr:cytochrome P450 [Halobacillus massiliensis]
MKTIPKDAGMDQTMNILREGYTFLPKRFEQLETDIFQTRVLGKKVICLTGEEGARLFYDNEKFQREKAIPKRIQKSLFGKHAIQTMDGNTHEHRKLLFMSLMTKERIKIFGEIVTKTWQQQAKQWEGSIVLMDEAKEVLCRSICEWSGVPLQEKEVKKRAEQLWALVDSFGGVGPRHWQGRMDRKKTENWIEETILNIREGKIEAPKGSAAYEMAFHRNLEGEPLDARMAAIELLNVLRPTVAVSLYITYAALALLEEPELTDKLKVADDEYIGMFAQEVRRYFPFAPFLGAIARRDFIWNDYPFKKGQMVFIDLHGVNHDKTLWESPYEFYPERFYGWNGSLYDLVPQGGGEHFKGHRCPGEWITVEAIKSSAKFLTNDIEYKIAENQDLEYDVSRIPAIPKSGVVLTNIKGV